ncbi:putative inner membrane protein [Klebsiella pneumoniae]|uniref:Putative inner membrane protein n=1 Tax=Klebsiella pneumoniae TaxID=573 RepID=A0A2X3KKW8_KLEPN|nr:putative inner membrane protein [Klebsiella pneumoniae]
MAILQTGLAYPVLVSCPGGHCRGHSLYLLFWHHRHLLGGDREFTRWGGQLLQLLGVHSEQWAITS